MNNEKIKKIALANGFKLKPQPDGKEDLNPYVYAFAQALLQTANVEIADSFGDGYYDGFLDGAKHHQQTDCTTLPNYLGEEALRCSEIAESKKAEKMGVRPLMTARKEKVLERFLAEYSIPCRLTIDRTTTYGKGLKLKHVINGLEARRNRPETPVVVDTYPVTIVVEVPKGQEFQLSALINVQGLEVKCTSIAWETNSVSEAFALEQRLEVALDLLEDRDIFTTDIDGYKSRLKELHEAGELTEHSIDKRLDLIFEGDDDEQS